MPWANFHPQSLGRLMLYNGTKIQGYNMIVLHSRTKLQHDKKEHSTQYKTIIMGDNNTQNAGYSLHRSERVTIAVYVP